MQRGVPGESLVIQIGLNRPPFHFIIPEYLPAVQTIPTMMTDGQVYTCVFVLNENRILLGYKKRGLLKDKWNGFGGKVEDGETVREAAFRELYEECGLTSETFFENGCLIVSTPEIPRAFVYLFTTRKYSGTVAESEEMLPKWFDVAEIPYDKMCCDSRLWLPLLLEGRQFDATVAYDNTGKIISQTINYL